MKKLIIISILLFTSNTLITTSDGREQGLYKLREKLEENLREKLEENKKSLKEYEEQLEKLRNKLLENAIKNHKKDIDELSRAIDAINNNKSYNAGIDSYLANGMTIWRSISLKERNNNYDIVFLDHYTGKQLANLTDMREAAKQYHENDAIAYIRKNLDKKNTYVCPIIPYQPSIVDNVNNFVFGTKIPQYIIPIIVGATDCSLCDKFKSQ